MKAAYFDYARAGSVNEALEYLIQEDARIIAGGQSLIPLMAMRLSYPSILVDVNSIAELQTVTLSEESISCGAAVTQSRFCEALSAQTPHAGLFISVISNIGSVAIRNRGTVGGTLSHADSSAEWPALVLALRAELEVAGPTGLRRISSDDFFVGPFTTALRTNEILTSVHIPLGGFNTWGFYEISRRSDDFALAGCVLVAQADYHSLSNTHIVLFGCASTPIRLRELEALISGVSWSEATEIVQDFDFPEQLSNDLHVSSEVRAHLARGAIRRSLDNAFSRLGP